MLHDQLKTAANRHPLPGHRSISFLYVKIVCIYIGNKKEILKQSPGGLHCCHTASLGRGSVSQQDLFGDGKHDRDGCAKNQFLSFFSQKPNVMQLQLRLDRERRGQ